MKFPAIQEVIDSIPNSEGSFTVKFRGGDFDGDETDEKKAQQVWGKKCHVLTLDMVIRFPFNTPIVATWGNHLCYDGEYNDKKSVLTTITFEMLKKIETDMMLADVNIIAGHRYDPDSPSLNQEEFYIYHNQSRYMRCGGNHWPIYVFY
jgi:hypothetical protein